MQIDVNTEFISCGCSATPHSLDWSENDNVIAIGSSHNVCLIKLEDQKCASQIVHSSCEHAGDVTCVKFVKSTAKLDYSLLLTGSTDNSAVLWELRDYNLRPLSKLSAHSMAVKYVCGLYIQNQNSVYIATCSADSSLKIWAIALNSDSNEVKEQQTIDYERGFALCADFCYISEGGMLMAVGNDDNKIRIYYQCSSISHFEAFKEVTSIPGHEDWIRGLSFSCSVLTDFVYLASCSQDNYARIWSVQMSKSNSVNEKQRLENGDLQLRPHLFNIKSVENDQGQIFCEVTLETVLSGHDSWIYSVSWNKNNRQLITASIDKSVIIWEPDPISDVWIAKVQLGEIGGPVAGFYGAVFSPDGNSIIAHSFLGGLHFWKRNIDGCWMARVIPTGHFNCVEDISWDPHGNYLLSCSRDQSTRLFAAWKREGKQPTYHEIARPQVHGHDMKCLAIVNSFCFVSGAEEKILRAFVAPHSFVEHLKLFSNLNQEITDNFLSRYGHIEGASVPALGLSNKAIFASDLNSVTNDKEKGDQNDNDERYPIFSFQKSHLTEPPTEDFLMQNTLWPEIHKLYGHGFELFSVASNNTGTVIASACKASKTEHARIIIWSTEDWQQKSQLEGHSLTVTQLEFSPDDRYLLTVSRDRTWFLYSRGEDDFSWKKIANTDKKTCVHARIIWSCAWTHDSKYFVTVSRDKKLVCWDRSQICEGKLTEAASVLDTSDSTTAVACAPNFALNNEYLIAYGLENGEICICSWNSQTKSFSILRNMNRNVAHALTVKRLRFNPKMDNENCENLDTNFVLASCSDDHSVKLYRIKLKTDKKMI